MKAVIQRVRSASVESGGEEVSRIGPGLLVLFGVGRGEAEALAIALHAISVVPVTIIGLILAWKYGFSMPRAADEPEDQS